MIRWNTPLATSLRSCARVGDGVVPSNPPMGSTSSPLASM
jgi:hypothetical protein